MKGRNTHTDLLNVFIKKVVARYNIAEEDINPALKIEMSSGAKPQFSLQEVVIALKHALGETGLQGIAKDREVLSKMVCVINGIDGERRKSHIPPKAVITHSNVDLDACVCIALSRVNLKDVHFLPAQFPNIPNVCPCCRRSLPSNVRDIRILDHPLGLKGSILNGKGGSAACAMPEAKGSSSKLLQELTEAETSGMANPRFYLGEIIFLLANEFRRQGLGESQANLEVAIIMEQIIYGLIIRYRKLRAAHEEVSKIHIEEFPSFRVAILPLGPTPPELGIALAGEANVTCAIYQDRFDLGVTRYAGRTLPDLTRLAEFLPDWFIHPQGFLCCWGSRKSRAVCLPPEGTPQNQEQLLALMRQVFGNP